MKITKQVRERFLIHGLGLDEDEVMAMPDFVKRELCEDAKDALLEFMEDYYGR